MKTNVVVRMTVPSSKVAAKVEVAPPRSKKKVTATDAELPPAEGANTKANGSVDGALNRAKAGGAKIAGANSPLFLINGDGAKKELTLILRAKANERGFGMFPREVAEALEKLAKKNPGLRELPSSEMGATIFAMQHVYKVPSALLPKIEKILAKHKDVAITSLDGILAAKTSRKEFSPALVTALKSGTLLDQVSALLDLGRLLGREGGVPADAETRNAIGDAAYSLASPLVDLHNATQIEESRARREALLQNKPTVRDGIGEGLQAYFDASAQAHTELRASGRTPALNALRKLILKTAEVLDQLGTPRSASLLSQLAPMGDGIIFDHLEKNTQSASRLIDHDLGIARSRMDQTLESMGKERVEGGPQYRGTGRSGGYESFRGHRQTMSSYVWTADHPFEDTPRTALMFLGTNMSPETRAQLLRIFVDADTQFPKLAEKHFAQFQEKETKQWKQMIEGIVARSPEEKKAKVREDLEKQMNEDVLGRYDEFQRLTGQSDIETLVNGLVYVNSPGATSFSPARAAANVFGLFADMLGVVKSHEMHRMYADAALQALQSATFDEAAAGNAAVQRERERLIMALVTPGPDPDVHLNAAALLARIGETRGIELVKLGMKSANEDVRSDAVTTLGTLALAAKAPETIRERNLAKLADAMKNDRVREAVANAVRGAMPGLLERLEDPESGWLQLSAARTIARIDPTEARALEKARKLLEPEVTAFRFGAKNYGSKNVHVRMEAARVLGELGAAARAALPDLDAAIDLGKKAAEALAKIEVRQKAEVERTKTEYIINEDPEGLAIAKPVLELAAGPNTPAKRALEFVADPNSPKLRDIASYRRSDYPSVEGVLHEMVELGKVAAESRKKIAE